MALQPSMDVRLGAAVAAVGPTCVRLQAGEDSKTPTLMWAAGVRATPVVERLGVPQGRGGRMTRHPDVRVPAPPEMCGVGDRGTVASDGTILPHLGSVARQSGDHGGRQRARR